MEEKVLNSSEQIFCGQPSESLPFFVNFLFPFFLKEDYKAFLRTTGSPTVYKGLETPYALGTLKGTTIMKIPITTNSNRNNYENKKTDPMFWVSEPQCSYSYKLSKIHFEKPQQSD